MHIKTWFSAPNSVHEWKTMFLHWEYKRFSDVHSFFRYHWFSYFCMQYMQCILVSKFGFWIGIWILHLELKFCKIIINFCTKWILFMKCKYVGPRLQFKIVHCDEWALKNSLEKLQIWNFKWFSLACVLKTIYLLMKIWKRALQYMYCHIRITIQKQIHVFFVSCIVFFGSLERNLKKYKRPTIQHNTFVLHCIVFVFLYCCEPWF